MLASSSSSAEELARMRTPQWARLVDPARGMLVQIGANDHSNNGYVNTADPGPLAVSLGWRSLLIEPMPGPFSRLKTKYEGRIEEAKLRLVNKAVCSTCDAPDAEMWYVDLSNTSSIAVRCALAIADDDTGWINELPSFDKRHVLKHDYVFGYRPKGCKRCAERIGMPELPPTCLKNVVRDNVQRRATPCTCLERELTAEKAVTLLVVDTEGYDAEVLRRYPFARIPTTRVLFETVHLNRNAMNATFELLRSHGFEPVAHESSTARRSADTWHHTSHSTPLLAGAAGRAHGHLKEPGPMPGTRARTLRRQR